MALAPQQEESDRWWVTLLVATLPVVLTQVGEGVREWLERRHTEREDGEADA